MRVGGSEIQLLHLMKGLIGEFELTLICTRSEGALIGDARRAGAYVRVLDARSGWDFRMQGRLQHIFQAHTPHIMHSYLSGFDLFANRAARNAGIPIILSSRRELATWQQGRHRFMQRLANKYTDCIVANSHAVAEYAAGQEGEPMSRFRIIPNGVEPERFVATVPRDQITSRFRLPPHSLNIGMVANFSPVKDHRLFLDMASLILKERQDVHFLLVGTGALADSVADLIRRRKQERYFTRVGTVGEVSDLLHVMDVTVLTSRMEGFPNAVIEAMSACKPCVAGRVGGIPELIDDGVTGCLVEPRSAEAFARRVLELLADPARRVRLGQAAGAWVRGHLPMAQMINGHRLLYHELLRQKLRKGA
jgi:glycosyltransferase involved in cell wall biosynthesis